MTEATKLMAAAKKTKSHRAYAMIKGRFSALLQRKGLSAPLYHSAMRTFSRVCLHPWYRESEGVR